MYLINFLIFEYIPLPCLTAETIVAKLSSIRTMADASLVTSVPLIPMAIPISASLTAGASFTPSPVMATIWLFFLSALTILSLCTGRTLANTAVFSTTFSSSVSLILSSSSPVIILSPFCIISSSFAITLAVILWSPVIIIVFIPAFLHKATASLTSGLGGSMRPAIPTKTRSFSRSS